MTTAHHQQPAIEAMQAGLALTVAAMIVAYVDPFHRQRAGRPRRKS